MLHHSKDLENEQGEGGTKEWPTQTPPQHYTPLQKVKVSQKKTCSSTTEVLDYLTKCIVPRFLRRMLQWKIVIIAKERRQWRLDRLFIGKIKLLTQLFTKKPWKRWHENTHHHWMQTLTRDIQFLSCIVLDSETLTTWINCFNQEFPHVCLSRLSWCSDNSGKWSLKRH